MFTPQGCWQDVKNVLKCDWLLRFMKVMLLIFHCSENVFCLIGRVARVGEGHRLAAKRRAWFRREEERREDSRRAQWAVNMVWRGVFRGKGNFVTSTLLKQITSDQNIHQK